MRRLTWSRRATIGLVALLIAGLVVPPTRAPAADGSSAMVDVAVVRSADDAEELASGYLDTTSSDLELAVERVPQTIGLRFVGLPIPPNATITAAWIQFTVDEVSTGPASLTIRAHDTANPAAFSGTRGITSRATTAASVAWTPAPWPTVGAAATDQRTPDLSPVLQAIINRPDWTTGNPLALILSGTGTRTAESFNGTAAPVLHLQWTTGTPTTTTTTTTTVPTTTTTTTIPANQPPSVVASASPTVSGGTSTLEAQVSDDGLPNPPGATSVLWEQIDGPATATITDPHSAVTTAVLLSEGEYRFSATASDGELTTVKVAVATVSPAAAGSTRIAVIGDWGGQPDRQLMVRNMIDAWGPSAVVTVGDNIYWNGGFDQVVGQYYHQYIGGYTGAYGAGSPFNRFFPALGNHDYTDGGLGNYLGFFDLPGPGVSTTGTSGNERYYDVRLGGVHIFVVNSNPEEPNGLTPTSTQGQWLQAALQGSDAEWKLVVFHHPPYSSMPGKTSSWMDWPFREWGADLVLSGHAHVYERLRADGLDYVITGLGVNNTPLDNPTIPESQAFWSEDAPGALFIVACPGALHLDFRPVGYGIVDSYTIGSGSCP
ncbi:MAG: metallophosphoesterase [Actinomycetota bacterium]